MRTTAILTTLALALGACGGDGKGGADAAAMQDTAQETAAAPADTPPPEDTPRPKDTGPESFTTGISAKGYGEYCTSSADCATDGLECFTTGPDDLYAQCSTSCTDNMDCSEYHTCNLKLGGAHPPQICTVSDYCSPCQDDVQCMLPGMRCLEDTAGAGFCSPPCVPGTPSCAAGSRCVYEELLGDFYCRPIWGACLGDGAQCAPCRYDPDCVSGYFCLEMMYSKEKFCSEPCEGDDDCLGDMACVAGGPGGANVCFPTWNGKPVPSCYVETEGFCNACIKDYNCQSGICYYSYGGADGGFCTHECVLAADCPEGMSCVARYDLYDNSLAGYACAPVGEDASTCADHLLAAEE